MASIHPDQGNIGDSVKMKQHRIQPAKPPEATTTRCRHNQPKHQHQKPKSIGGDPATSNCDTTDTMLLETMSGSDQLCHHGVHSAP
jgi:hypothetical protein